MQGRLVAAVAEPAAARLALELGDRAEREVEDLEGMPGTQRHEPRRLGVVVPRLDLDVRVRPVGDLLMGVVDRLLGAGMRRDARAGRSSARRRTRRRRGGAGSGASSRGRRRTAAARSRGRPSASRRAATRTRRRRSGSPSRRRTRSRRAVPCASPTRAWRMSSPGSRSSRRWPARSYRSRISVVPSLEALSVAMTWSTPAWRWNAMLRVDDVRLVASEKCHDDLHGRAQSRGAHARSTYGPKPCPRPSMRSSSRTVTFDASWTRRANVSPRPSGAAGGGSIPGSSAAERSTSTEPTPVEPRDVRPPSVAAPTASTPPDEKPAAVVAPFLDEVVRPCRSFT